MTSILNKISTKENAIAVLIDPDKFESILDKYEFIHQLNDLEPEFIFVGGSMVAQEDFLKCIDFLKKHSSISLVIFPGNFDQISHSADGILLLSLLSSKNYEYIFGQHIKASKTLEDSSIEIIPTAYLLIDGGKTSAVQQVTQSIPLQQEEIEQSKKITLAAKQLGMKLVYLDAGSGALFTVNEKMIQVVSQCGLPLIVGGGVRDIRTIEKIHNAGANLVVIGNHLETENNFFLELKDYKKKLTIKKSLQTQIETFD